MNIWIWSIGGMTLTGVNWNTWRKPCPSADLSTHFHMDWPGIVHGSRQWEAIINCLKHGTANWRVEYYLFTLIPPAFYYTLLIWGSILWRGALCSTSNPINDKTKCFSGQIWLEYTFLAKDQHMYEHQSCFTNHSKHFKFCQINTVIAMTSLLIWFSLQEHFVLRIPINYAVVIRV